MQSRHNMYLKFLQSKSLPKLYYSGRALGQADVKQLIFVFATWVSILGETPGLAEDMQQREKFARIYSGTNLKRLFRRLLQADFARTFEQLGLYKMLLQQWLITGRCVKKLGKQCGVDKNFILWEFLSPLFVSQKQNWLTHMNTCVSFPKRTSLEGDASELEKDAFQSYLDDEALLKELDENSSFESDPLCCKLRRIVADMWQGFDKFEPELLYLHGTGATAETRKGAGYDEKVAAVKVSRQLVSVLDAVGWRPNPYLYGGIGNLMPSVIQRWKSDFPHLLEIMGVAELPEDDTPCEWSTVPKNAEKRRGISLEGAGRAFAQKAAAYPQRLFMARKGRFHVDLFDQSKNQKLCVKGSRDGSFTTGDLSSASDLNRASLVWFLFQDVPLVRDLLFLTRSETVSFRRFSSEVGDLRLRKFAPMGSAECFPALCTVLSAVIELAYEQLGIHDDYRVYGDDIILRTEAWPLVCEYLSKLGFKVNLEKSFSTGLYRESCGVEAFGGYDITPLKISQLFQIARKGARGSVEHFEGLTSLANRLWTYGYNSTRSSICRFIRGLYPLVAFSHNAEHGVLTTKCELNQHLSWRMENGLLYVKTYSTENRQKKIADDLRYARWLEDAQSREFSYLPTPLDRGAFKGGKTDARLKVAWIPAWDYDYK